MNVGDGDNVPVRARFKSGHVRSRPLDWTKELQCAKFGVNAALATAKAPCARTEPVLARLNCDVGSRAQKI